jgi:hypothetical protein
MVDTGPGTSVDPDCPEASRSSAGNVGDKAVSDHPAPGVETHATPLGSDHEQPAVRLANACDPGKRIGVHSIGEFCLLDLSELVVRDPVGNDGHRPTPHAKS